MTNRLSVTNASMEEGIDGSHNLDGESVGTPGWAAPEALLGW